MAIDTDIQSFSEYNANVTDMNNKLNAFWGLVGQTPTSADTNKVVIERSNIWKYEGEERYNGLFQSFGNISGKVSLSVNNSTGRTAVLATITGDTFVTDFGENVISGVIYTLFLKQDVVGNHSFRWPYGASVLNSVDIAPDEITVVQFIKLPSGLFFIKCSAFTEAALNGFVIKEFKEPEITYPDGSQAPMSFTWTKAPAVGYGGTVSGLYSDWEIADDILYTNLLFSSYNNTSDLYSIQVVLTQAGTVYMRTRFGGVIGGDAIVSPWDEAVCELAGMGGGDKYWDQTVLCINANKYGWEGSRKIVDEKGWSTLTLVGDTKVIDVSGKWAINFDGSGDYFTLPDSNIFSFPSDFTVEAYIYDLSTVIMGKCNDGTSYGEFLFGIQTNGALVFAGRSDGGSSGGWEFNVTSAIPSSYTKAAINHVAFCRKNGTVYFILNGSVLSTLVNSTSIGNGTSPVSIGANKNSSEFVANGKLISIRVTKNIARYTSDFQVDLADPYFKTGNLWWTPEPKEIATDNFVGKDYWDNIYHCFNFYGALGTTTFKDLSNIHTPVTTVGNSQIGVSSDWSFLLLDGSGDRLVFPTNFNPNIPNWGIDVLVYITSSSDNNTILHIAAGSNGGLHIWCNTSGYLIVDNGLDGTTAGNIALSLNTLYHVTVRNISGVIYGYVNGVQCLTHTAQSYIIPTTCSLGAFIPTASHDFTGRIYSLKIEQGAYTAVNFTPKTVANPYFITKPKVENWAETSLLINALDLPVGSTDIRDFKGNAISLYGDTKVAVDSNGLEYINFDGSGDYLQSSTSSGLSSFGSSDFTIDFYLNAASGAQTGSVLGSWYSSGNLSWYIRVLSDNSWDFIYSITGSDGFIIAAPINAATRNKVTRYTVVRSSSLLLFFEDGILVKSQSIAGLTIYSPSSAVFFEVGRNTTGTVYYLSGKLYSYRIIKGKALYTSNFNVDLTNPYFPAYENALADLWIDANDYSKMTMATGVSKIVDKSGNMREAVQATAASQPALVQNAQNGLMGLGLDGVDDSLLINSSFIGVRELWIFAVVKCYAEYGGILTSRPGANDASPGMLVSNTGRIEMHGESTKASKVAISPIENTDWTVAFGKLETDRAYLSIDGNNFVAASSTFSAIYGTAATTAIGLYRITDGNYGKLYIGEIFAISSKTLSSFWGVILQGFFAHKWALTDRLPAAHPYKSGFPVEDSRTDDYWYATVLCINGTDIIRPTEIVDSSRNNKITVYGDVKALVDSNNKPYINFDGTSDCIYFPANNCNFLASDFTIEYFLEKTANNANSSRLFNANGDICHNIEIAISAGGLLSMGVSSNGTTWNIYSGDVSGFSIPNGGGILHLAIVRHGSNLYAFLNGAKTIVSSSLGTTSLFSTTGQLKSIGGQSTGTNRSLNGKIYSARVTKGIARYTENFDVDLTNPYFPKKSGRDVHWDKMVVFLNADGNETTTPSKDTIGNNITYYNGAAIDNTLGYPAFYFDGSNDYLSIPAPAGGWGLNNEYTLDWFAYSGTGSKIGSICIGTYNSGNWYELCFSIRDSWVSPIIYLYATVSANEQYYDWTTKSASVSANTLYHFALVRSGSVGKFYVNGVLAWEKTGLTSNAESTKPMIIGRWDYTYAPEPSQIRIPCLRLTKVVRWDSDFTPPSFPFNR